MKLTKTPILPNCQVPNDFSINEFMKFCKIPQLFIVSVSLARANLRLLRELFIQKNLAINSR